MNIIAIIYENISKDKLVNIKNVNPKIIYIIEVINDIFIILLNFSLIKASYYIVILLFFYLKVNGSKTIYG